MISYNVIVGDTITRVVARLIGYDILWARDIVTLVTSIVLTFPLSLYRLLPRRVNFNNIFMSSFSVNGFTPLFWGTG